VKRNLRNIRPDTQRKADTTAFFLQGGKIVFLRMQFFACVAAVATCANGELCDSGAVRIRNGATLEVAMESRIMADDATDWVTDWATDCATDAAMDGATDWEVRHTDG